MIFRILVFCFLASTSALTFAQNMEPKTEDDYIDVIKQCYTEELKEKWRMISFSYSRGEKDSEGKQVVNVSARYLARDGNWHDAISCHPLAPAVITEYYLKNIGKFGDNFKAIQVSIYTVTRGKVEIIEK